MVGWILRLNPIRSDQWMSLLYAALSIGKSRVDSDSGTCHAQVLCWFSTVGYRITGVDEIDRLDKPDTQELNIRDWTEFPSELVLSLKDPLLPPGLLLEVSGTWNNPCRSLVPPRDDAHWEPYKDQWCTAKMASFSYNFVPCNVWGEFPTKEVIMPRWVAALPCVGGRGEECQGWQLTGLKACGIIELTSLPVAHAGRARNDIMAKAESNQRKDFQSQNSL